MEELNEITQDVLDAKVKDLVAMAKSIDDTVARVSLLCLDARGCGDLPLDTSDLKDALLALKARAGSSARYLDGLWAFCCENA